MNRPHTHLDDTRFQALIDGELPAAEAARLRAEIDACARCTAEFEGWQLLFSDLDDLEILAPSTGFSDRILGSLPESRPHGVRSILRRPAEATSPGHLSGERIQDFLDGRLAARVIAGVESHLGECAVCRDEVSAHRRVMTALGGLPRLAPSTEFAERVMAGVRVRQMVEFAMAPTTPRERALAWLRRMVPDSRQGWAAAMGVLVTPVTLAVLVVRAVFTNDLVTVSNLTAFAWLKLSDSVGAATSGLRDLLLEQSAVRLALDLFELTGGGAAIIAASGAGLVVATMAALWIVYQNVLTPPAGEGPYAHLSF